MGNPNISKARDLIQIIFHRREIVRHSKISHLKLFPDPPYIRVELWGHPQPHGGPQHQQGQRLISEHFIEVILLGIVKLVILNFFLDPPDIRVVLWDAPHPLGGP